MVNKEGEYMVNKETLHLGQRVLVTDGQLEGVIDALTQTFVGVNIVGGGYALYDYDEIEVIDK